MRLIDSAKKSIYKYPTIFLCENLTDSIFNVLHHYFIVLGNGMAWAKTTDPQNGGYLVSEKLVKRKGVWTRELDQDYGVETFNENLDKYFLEKQFVVFLKMSPMKTKIVPESELANYEGKKSFQIKNVKRVNPYPNFTKEYSLFWESSAEFIKEDWMLAALEQLSYWLKYFQDDERVANYCYRKSGGQQSERRDSINFLEATISRILSK